MKKIISNNQKKDFIKWFLDSYTLRKRELLWILNYISSKDKLLSNVHFVDSAKYYKNGMILKTVCCREKGVFQFFVDADTQHTDPEKAFQYMRLHQDEKFYIELHFHDNYRQDIHLNILEEMKHDFDTDISETAKNVIDRLEYKLKVQFILKKIDETLVTGDIDAFLILSSEYKELLKSKPDDAIYWVNTP